MKKIVKMKEFIALVQAQTKSQATLQLVTNFAVIVKNLVKASNVAMGFIPATSWSLTIMVNVFLCSVILSAGNTELCRLLCAINCAKRRMLTPFERS